VRGALLLAFVALLAAACGAVPNGDRQTASVERVGDGDSFVLQGDERVRLLQVDAPELGEGECYADQATQLLRALLRPGEAVELEADPALDDTDRYGRLLRYAIADGLNVSVELVRQGAATPYFRGGERGRYADELLAAADVAREERRGMWAVCRVTWSPTRQVETEPR
jgi:endonuclease YncB( thermonuclease family)